ncbi:hypothetical protein BT69DRAFT_53213 [Atractiella rhizophila]|nr:hypothetical protein BT69DRAFT_53213 [Atractiella rhizophila]
MSTHLLPDIEVNNEMADGERGGQCGQCWIRDHKWTSRPAPLMLLSLCPPYRYSLKCHLSSGK